MNVWPTCLARRTLPCIAVSLLKRAALMQLEAKPVAAEAVLRKSIIDDILACVRHVSGRSS